MSTHSATFTHTRTGSWSLDSDVMNLEFPDMLACRRAFPKSVLYFRPRNGDTLELIGEVALERGRWRWAFRRTENGLLQPNPGPEYMVLRDNRL